MRLIMNGSQLLDLTLALGSLAWWKKNISLALLALGIVISVFAIVIVKTNTRQQYIDFQEIQYHHNQLRYEQAQLTLEKGVLASDIHIMSLAQNQLHMQLPQGKNVVMVQV
jgi:cell division protein FtsL